MQYCDNTLIIMQIFSGARWDCEWRAIFELREEVGGVFAELRKVRVSGIRRATKRRDGTGPLALRGIYFKPE